MKIGIQTHYSAIGRNGAILDPDFRQDDGVSGI